MKNAQNYTKMYQIEGKNKWGKESEKLIWKTENLRHVTLTVTNLYKDWSMQSLDSNWIDSLDGVNCYFLWHYIGTDVFPNFQISPNLGLKRSNS